MNLQFKKLIPIALTFISVGLLLAVVLFLVFSNQPTIALILGLIAGLALSMIAVVVIHRLVAFNKKEPQDQHEDVLDKIFKKWGLKATAEEAHSIKSSIELGIKSFAASWMLFGAIAIALSTALYYATVLQARQLEQQNTIVVEQNNLLCMQNNLASTANKLELYKISIEQASSSVGALNNIKDTMISSFTRIEKCESTNCRNNTDGLQIHEVNSDIRLYGRDAFSEKQFNNIMSKWKELYPQTLGAFAISDVNEKQTKFKNYREFLSQSISIIDKEVQRYERDLMEQKSQLEQPLKECSQS